MMRIVNWFGLFLACVLTASAQSVPYSFNYQGVLRDGGGGAVVAGTKTVSFQLYSQAVSGTVLWGRSNAVMLNTNGLFNVELSDDTGSRIPGTPTNLLQTVIAGSKMLYLGLTVTAPAPASSEILPRQQLLSVPFAIMAGDVQAASGTFTVSGSLEALKGVDVKAPGMISGYGTIPRQGIIMWSGSQSAIPDGWALCNGQDGTPDLRNRFIVGAGDDYSLGNMGGAAQVTLTTAQIPKHTHQFHDGYYIERKKTDDASYNKFPAGGGQEDVAEEVTGSDGTDVDNNQIYWRLMTTVNSTDGGGAHENRPPYYALCFIIRIK